MPVESRLQRPCIFPHIKAPLAQSRSLRFPSSCSTSIICAYPPRKCRWASHSYRRSSGDQTDPRLALSVLAEADLPHTEITDGSVALAVFSAEHHAKCVQIRILRRPPVRVAHGKRQFLSRHAARGCVRPIAIEGNRGYRRIRPLSLCAVTCGTCASKSGVIGR
jgi:hypothetical protein